MTANIERTNPNEADASLWWWRGQMWPHVDPNLTDGGNPLKLHEFYPLKITGNWTDNHWGPYPYARSVLHEFAVAFNANVTAAGAPNIPHFPATISDPVIFFDPNAANPVKQWERTLDQELIELIGLMEFRPGAIDEALEQADSIDQCFSGVITFNRITHPNTAKLAALGVVAGGHVAHLFKGHYNRPRPSQLCPTLMPPIDPPEHSSFPSGHATEAWLVALLLEEAIGATLTPGTVDGGKKLEHPMHDIARRIARNREIMGLHYPSDSEAGRRLAHAAFDTIKTAPAASKIGKLLADAKGEW